MLKKLFTYAIIILVLGLFLYLEADQWHGQYSLLSLPAPSRIVTKSITQNHIHPKTVTGTWGVSFGEVATPAENLSITDLSLHYDHSAQDGHRCQLSINNQDVETSIYDWQLIPAAHFAKNDTFSIFTLFGDLEDEQFQAVIESAHGYILNYHPELTNSLMGLRLYHIDILPMFSFSADLPKEDDNYILGEGETTPDVTQNQIGLNNLLSYWDSVQNELGVQHRSWIVTDFNSNVVFDIDQQQLLMSATPYFYFWRFNMDKPDFDSLTVITELDSLLQSDFQSEQQNDPNLTFQDWVIKRLILALKKYEQDYPMLLMGTIEDILDLPDDASREVFLRRYDPQSLYDNLLLPLEYIFVAFAVDPLLEFGNRISSRPDLLSAVNPAVWEATKTFMNYAALFRYCRIHYPDVWNTFMQQIQYRPVTPIMKTPTAMYEAPNTYVENYIAGRPAQPPHITGLPDFAFDADEEFVLHLDQFVLDEDSRFDQLTWIVEQASAFNVESRLASYQMNYINPRAVRSKNTNLKTNYPNLLTQSKIKVHSSNLINTNSLMVTKQNHLTISIDNQSHVATFSTSDPTISANYTVIFKVTDQTDFSDQDTIHVSVTAASKVIQNVANPKQFNLSQNYPNPFNPCTIISIDIPITAHIDLSIYNLNGQIIRNLVNKKINKGTLRVTWDGYSDAGFKVASGVYLYLLKVEHHGKVEFIESKKMALMR